MKKLLLVLCLTMVPGLAHSATYYVAKTGSDSNGCQNAQSSSAARLTINAGAACLSAGDTLLVKAGTYGEGLNAAIPNGTSGNPVTVKANPGDVVVLQPTATVGGTLSAYLFNGNHYIVVDGFVVDLSRFNNTGASGTQQKSGFGFYNSDHITLQNTEIKNCSGEGGTAPCSGLFVHPSS